MYFTALLALFLSGCLVPKPDADSSVGTPNAPVPPDTGDQRDTGGADANTGVAGDSDGADTADTADAADTADTAQADPFPGCVILTSAPDGREYLACSVAKVDHAGALTTCHGLGARLASFGSVETYRALASDATVILGREWWVGLSDNANEGVWLSEDDPATPFPGKAAWSSGEPNNVGGAEDFAVGGYLEEGGLCDVPENELHYVLCVVL